MNELMPGIRILEIIAASLREEIAPVADEDGNRYFCISCRQRINENRCNHCRSEDLIIPIFHVNANADVVGNNMELSDDLKGLIVKTLKLYSAENNVGKMP